MATTKITSPDLFNLESLNSALKLPSGTTAQRPTSPSTGEWRYNTTTNYVEFWDGGEWRDLQSEDIPPIPSENFGIVTYTGNGSTQSITGLGFKPDWVWMKRRNATQSHFAADSTRGVTKYVMPNESSAELTRSDQIQTFDADGFSLGSNADVNENNQPYVAWCWKADGGTTSSNTDGDITSTVQVNAKAGFSIITYTGNGSSAQTVGHGLGVAPKIIFIKERTGSNSWDDWIVGGDEIDNWTKYMRLNITSPPAAGFQTAPFSDTAPTSSVLTVTYQGGAGINGNGDTFVAYAFAEKAGYSKFGTYTGNGTTQVVNTGFQPAWIMIKSTVGNDNWRMYDTTRGISAGGYLIADTSAAEDTANAPNLLILSNGFEITAGGTTVGNNANGNLYTYYAFAADASAAPSLADSFANKLYAGTGSSNSLTGLGFSPSLVWIKNRTSAASHSWTDSVRGNNLVLQSNETAAEASGQITLDTDGFTIGNNNFLRNASGNNYVAWNWKANSIPTINTDGTIQSVVSASQASGFSIVKYTGNATSGATVGHGLSNAPDVVIAKGSSGSASSWWVRHKDLSSTDVLELNSSNAQANYSSVFNNTDPTSTVVTLGSGDTNRNTETQILYCFTSISGFSKMSSYTGNSSTQAITGLGFSPNWVLLKETDGVDSWEVYDTARGATSVLYPNGNNAEGTNSGVTSFDSDGFTLGSATSANESGKTYIYMAFIENPSPIVPAGQVAYLVVAGAGGGGGNRLNGNQNGGAGGAGGLRTSFGLTSGGGASAESNITLSAQTYTITVGAGGAAGITDTGRAGNGADSVFSTITSLGGGSGGSQLAGALPRAGGSGGGGSTNGAGGTAGGAGTANQGFAGGTSAGYGASGGGGGGASAVGQGLNAGTGGAGLEVSITGAGVAYAGGGGGSVSNGGGAAGAGGVGGGGAGAPGSGAGNSGTTNSGGGGGGGYGGYDGGPGGSGVVILRLRTTDYSGSTTGSPTITTRGEETILTYTGSGTYVHS